MKGKWATKGGFSKNKQSSDPQKFFVIGISKDTSLFDYGVHDDFEKSKQLADAQGSEDLTCYVYSSDNRVLYSTER